MLALVVLLVVGLCGVSALPAAQSDAPCTRDDLFTSLSRHGRPFCSSVLEGRCRQSTTPTQYATYDPDVLSRHCECVLADTCAHSATWTSGGVPTVTSAESSPRITVTLTGPSTRTTPGSGTPTVTYVSGSSRASTASGSPSSDGRDDSTSGRVTATPSSSSSSEAKTETRKSQASSGESSSTVAPDPGSPTGSTTTSSGFPGQTGPSSGIRQPSSGLTASTVSGGGRWNTSSTAASSSSNSGAPTASSDPDGAGSTTSLTSAETQTRWNSSSSSRVGTGAATTSGTGVASSPAGTATGSDTSGAGGPGATVAPTPLPAENFTQVTRAGAVTERTCYHLPADPVRGPSRRATPHNDELREGNYTIPVPYIESVDFGADGVAPLFLTLRDAANGTHYIDVSRRDRVSIVDSLGNAMLLDGRGIHFSTNSCRWDVSIAVDGLYQQLADLSGHVCSKGRLAERQEQQQQQQGPAPPGEAHFRQTVYLRDQCGTAVGRAVRKYPLLRVGATECLEAEVDEAGGRWVFDCPFPGSDSAAARCRRAARAGIFKFLFVAPFGGACPDLSTVITTLESDSKDFLNADSLRAGLYAQGLDAGQRAEADLAVMYYEQLWELLKQAFSRSRTSPPGVASAVQEYIDTYRSLRDFDDDLCRDLHAPDPPLNLSLRAGASDLPAVAALAAAPPAPPPPLNLTVQDPAQVACCPRGSVSSFGRGSGACAYPDSAIIGDSGCVCGRTASNASVAFEYTECNNFVARCSVDADCDVDAHPGFVCLIGSCCGGGVCVDPYECSRNGTGLIRRLAM
ncbi:hypothetical protein CDD83_4198 [Cordyceps sp. RAO-2017]|nr:hypothetical protein CDD83_4198 [Cordyceps sp. RAO-2017]